jgi:hypothetical protein
MFLLRIAPYRQIADDVADRLVASRRPDDPLSPWQEEVIVPSRGVADAIATSLLARSPSGIAGLQLQSIETFAQRLVNASGRTPRVATPAERRLAMRSAVRVSSHPMMEGRGVAAMIERAYRDMRDGGITLAEFSRRASRARGLRDARRTEALISAWQEYERLIAQLRAVDPADLIGKAIECIAPTIPRQILAGFYDVTGMQLALFETLARAGRIGGLWVPSDSAFAAPFIASMRRFTSDEERGPVDRALRHLAHSSRDALTRRAKRFGVRWPQTPLSQNQQSPTNTNLAPGARDLALYRSYVLESGGCGRRTPKRFARRRGRFARHVPNFSPTRDLALGRAAAEDGRGTAGADACATTRSSLLALPHRPPADLVPERAVVLYESRLTELREICGRVPLLLASGAPPSSIGIVARAWDPWEIRLLNRYANESGFRTTLQDERPLTAHRIGRGALALLRIRERGFPRTEVLELVRDGLRTETRIDVDATDLATRAARIAGGTSDDLAAMRGRSRTIDGYLSLLAEVEALTASIDEDFLGRLPDMFRVEAEADLSAVAALDEVAALFRRTKVWRRGFDLSAVVDAMEQISLSDTATSDLPSIWAGDVMHFRGRSFRHLFAVGMQDDVFPQRRIEDPLVPDSDRRLLGVREIGDGRAEELLLFSLLSDAASDSLELSYSVGDGFGKVLRPSRYLRSFNHRSGGSDILPSRNASPNFLRQLQLLARAGTRSAFDGYVGPLGELLRSKIDPVSPTQLEDFGECPQKFFLKHVLGVRDIDQPEHEIQINHRDKGSIDHRILERFYKSLDREKIAQTAAALPLLPDALLADLDRIIDEELDELERQMPPFNRTVREIERRGTRRLLREFIADDIDDLHAQQLVPRWFEYRFGSRYRDQADQPESYIVEAGGIPVRVEGTVDRIDAGGDLLRIVDYKSGKAARHGKLSDKIDRGVRLQLALYAMAIAHFFNAAPHNVSGTIKPLVVREARRTKFDFSLVEKHDRLLETLAIFVRAILAGEFPAFPNESDADFNSCKYCPVNHSCRTRHDAEERYSMQQFGDPRTLLGGSK